MATEAVPARPSEQHASATPRDASSTTAPAVPEHAVGAHGDTPAVEGNPDTGPGSGTGGGNAPGSGHTTPGDGGTTPGSGTGTGDSGGTTPGDGGTTTPPTTGDGGTTTPTPTPTPDPTGSPPTGGTGGGDAGDTTGPGNGTPPTNVPVPQPPQGHVPVPTPPPPGTNGGPTLALLPPAVAATLPTGELLQRSRNTIGQALSAGAIAGGGPTGASIVMRLLDSALARDANGHNVFDAKELSLVQERRRLEAELRRRGAAPDIVQRLLSNIIQQGQVQREREKVEGLLSLMTSICLGNIPKGLINRLVELGFGLEVEQVMRDAIGSGRHLSRGAIRDLMSLAASGLGTGGMSMPDVGTAPEHQIEEYYRDEDRRISRNATATGSARLVDPRRTPADEEPSTLSEALRARSVSTGWGSPASNASG